VTRTSIHAGYRLIRLAALGVLIALAAYWAGSRWGPRQPTSVQAFPAAQPEAAAEPAQTTLPAVARTGQLLPEEATNVKIYSQAAPAVANIVTRALEYDVFFDPVAVNGAGSGFVFDPRGYVLTNHHVIENAQQIEVTLGDRSRYTARVIGSDERNDVALLKIDPPRGKQLPYLTMGDSDGLQVGQSVLAIGNPFGFESTLTTGVVSALKRTVQTGPQTFIDGAVQTDAAINQGNSGGPLLNSKGEVIGINSAIYTPSGAAAGIGFAIPINTAREIAQDLITDGHVHRATLGIEARSFGPGLADALGLPVQQGLLIERVMPNSAAAAAGLRGGNRMAIVGMRRVLLGGDVLAEIDGQPINEDFDLTLMLNRRRPGDTVTLRIYRGNQRMDVKATLREQQQ
jgi:S1-C subfamily serine protease